MDQKHVIVSWVWVKEKWEPVNDKAWIWSDNDRRWVPQDHDGYTYNEAERMWVKQ